METNCEEYNYKDKTILIVEDDEVNYSYLTSALKKTKAKLLWAKTGEEALEIFNSNTGIYLILMDIRLPEINGFEVTRRIKQQNPEIIIIAQTGLAMKGDREKCLDAGCNDYIAKPFKPKQLLNILSKYMDKIPEKIQQPSGIQLTINRIRPLLADEIIDFVYVMRFGHQVSLCELCRQARDFYPHLQLNTEYEEGYFDGLALVQAVMEIKEQEMISKIKEGMWYPV